LSKFKRFGYYYLSCLRGLDITISLSSKFKKFRYYYISLV